MQDLAAPAGALNHIPADIFCGRDYEAYARRSIAAPAYDYIAGGSETGAAAARNLSAFESWTIVPRLLRDVRDGNTQLVLAGSAFEHPIFLAPVAFQNLAHRAAEIETARGAAAVDSCLIVSTLSARTLEDIARVAGPRRWFQLYAQPDRTVTLDLMRRAADAGYQAIVVTLDAAIQAQGHDALRAGFQFSGETPANLRTYPSPNSPPSDPARSRILHHAMRNAPIWSDLDWLATRSPLPVWVKGVLHPDDAEALKARGVTGLVVSNHGGRSLDSAPASLTVLPDIREAVGDAYPLLFDSGIRSGSDIFKALALGANAVLIGRLQLYALSVAGALGVAHMIRLLREELEICMAMTGCATLADIPASAPLRREAR